MNELPAEVLVRIGANLITDDINDVTIYNLGEYLEKKYAELAAFRQTSTSYTAVTNDVFDQVVNNIVKQLGILLADDVSPKAGYSSSLHLIQDIIKLNHWFKEIKEALFESNWDHYGDIITEYKKFTFPANNPIIPYLHFLLSYIYPTVNEALHLVSTKENFKFNQAIIQSAANGNLSALFAMRHYNLIDPSDQATLTKFKTVLQKYNITENDKTNYLKYAFNFTISHKLVPLFNSPPFQSIVKNYKLTDRDAIIKLIQNLIANTTLISNQAQSRNACINNQFNMNVPLECFGNPEHIALSKFLSETNLNASQQFLKSKIELLFKKITFNQKKFQQTFRNLNIEGDRVELVNKNLPVEISNELDNFITGNNGLYTEDLRAPYSKVLTLPWINLYKEWSAEQIHFFVHLWNAYIKPILPALKNDNRSFFKCLNNIFDITTILFMNAKWVKQPLSINFEKLNLVASILSPEQLKQVSGYPRSINDNYLYLLLNLDLSGIKKFQEVINYIANKKIEIDNQHIKFIIRYNQFIIDKDSNDKKSTNLFLSNAEIYKISSLKLDILISKSDTFLQWDRQFLIAYFNLKGKTANGLKFDKIDSSHFDNIIVKNKTDYDILINISKCEIRSRRLGNDLIREFGFDFANQIYQYHISSDKTLLIYLAELYPWGLITDGLKDVIIKNDKNVEKIVLELNNNALEQNDATNNVAMLPQAEQTVESNLNDNMQMTETESLDTAHSRSTAVTLYQQIEQDAVNNNNGNSIAGSSASHAMNMHTLFNKNHANDSVSHTSQHDHARYHPYQQAKK